MKETLSFRRYIVDRFRLALLPGDQDFKAGIALKAQYDMAWPAEPETLPAVMKHLEASGADEKTRAEVLVMWMYFFNQHWKDMGPDQIITTRQSATPHLTQAITNVQEKELVRQTLANLLRIEKQHFRGGDFAQGVSWSPPAGA